MKKFLFMMLSVALLSVVFTSCKDDDESYDTGLGDTAKNTTLVGQTWRLTNGNLNWTGKDYEGDDDSEDFAPDCLEFKANNVAVIDYKQGTFSYGADNKLKAVYNNKRDQEEDGEKWTEETMRIYEGTWTINGNTATYDCHFKGFDNDGDGTTHYEANGTLTYTKEVND